MHLGILCSALVPCTVASVTALCQAASLHFRTDSTCVHCTVANVNAPCKATSKHCRTDSTCVHCNVASVNALCLARHRLCVNSLTSTGQPLTVLVAAPCLPTQDRRQLSDSFLGQLCSRAAVLVPMNGVKAHCMLLWAVARLGECGKQQFAVCIARL